MIECMCNQKECAGRINFCKSGYFLKKKKTQINTCKRHFVQEQYHVWYNIYTYNGLLFYLLLISVYSSYDVFNVHIYFTIFCPIDSNLGLVSKYFTYTINYILQNSDIGKII